jgi:hypothetical protein
MTEPRKKKLSWADAAGVALGDPFGWFCVLVFASSWKVGLILLGALAAVGLITLITGLVILWVTRWDI